MNLVRLNPLSFDRKATRLEAHNLRGSNLISISVDMNFRILAEMNREVLILHRVVKHDTADRADVNRNDRATAVVQMSAAELQPEGLCEALMRLGLWKQKPSVSEAALQMMTFYCGRRCLNANFRPGTDALRDKWSSYSASSLSHASERRRMFANSGSWRR